MTDNVICNEGHLPLSVSDTVSVIRDGDISDTVSVIRDGDISDQIQVKY